MVAERLSISIPAEQSRFLEENPGYSASALLQQRISEVMQESKNNPMIKDLREQIERVNKARDKIQAEMLKQSEFITMKGNWEEYLKYAGNFA